MKRLSLNSYFMTIADAVAQRGTCKRGMSGAVIVKDKHIVSTGYNGTPPGAPHEPHHHTKEECNAIHAEINAITYADPEKLVGATIYITRSPCKSCAVALHMSGIKTVYFGDYHSSYPEVVNYFFERGITDLYHPNKIYEIVK